jgi:hypothetical protein
MFYDLIWGLWPLQTRAKYCYIFIIIRNTFWIMIDKFEEGGNA